MDKGVLSFPKGICSKVNVIARLEFEIVQNDIYIYIYRLIGLVGRVFTNASRDVGSILGRVIPKTFKMPKDTCLLNTQQYTVRIKVN